jgi:hypothetical protein
MSRKRNKHIRMGIKRQFFLVYVLHNQRQFNRVSRESIKACSIVKSKTGNFIHVGSICRVGEA